MSLSDNGNGMVMPVGPMYGNGSGAGFNSWGDGGLFWIIILFLFAWMGNGWGNGFCGGQAPAVNVQNDIQRGFDQQSVMAGINGLNASMYNAEVSRASGFNSVAMALQNCCCENRAGLADLKYTVATEACADRQSVNDALNTVTNAMNAGFQGIYNQMCQDKIDAKNEEIANLRTQLNISALRESQSDQTARVLADNANQTAVLRQALNPTPIPAYVVQNPNGGCNCGQNFYGCGC